MLLSGDQIHRTTTACIEVGCIGLLLCIDRNQNPFSIYGAFKNALAVRQHNTAECAIIEGIGVFFSFCKLCDPLCQPVCLRPIEACTQCRIPWLFSPFAPHSLP